MRRGKDERIVFALTGGLGNQLFQLAAAMYFGNTEKVNFEWHIARPRLNKDLHPEISSFTLPREIEFLAGKKWAKLVSKSSGYVLRMGIAPRRYEKFDLVQKSIRMMADIITTTYFGRRRKTLSPTGVGYSDFKIPSGDVLISGYFQSYRWASIPEIRERLNNLRIKKECEQLIKFKELARMENPLIVHIRLGDYKLESDFGILSKSYYLKAISSLDENLYKKIWVFSDEPDLAIEFIPQDLRHGVRWIPEIDDSASSTLELMRSGKAYVIGNSTFSWWGAFLSYSDNPIVIAPTPWFKNMASPNDILPPTWFALPGW